MWIGNLSGRLFDDAAVLCRLQEQGSYGELFQVLDEDLRDHSLAAILGIPGSDVTLDKVDILQGLSCAWSSAMT